MTEPVAHAGQLPDRRIELVGLRGQEPALDARGTLRREYETDLFEREASRTAEPDECEAIEHVGVERPVQAPTPDGGDEAFFLVEAERRGGKVGKLRDLGDVERAHALDLKCT